MKFGSYVFLLSVMCAESFALKERNIVNVVDQIIKSETISSECIENLKVYKDRLTNDTDFDDIWPLQMLDATSKIPVDVLSSSYSDTGRFTQCIEIESRRDGIMGKYCIGNILINSTVARSPSAQIDSQVYIQYLTIKTPDQIQTRMGNYPTWAICLPSNCTHTDARQIISVSQPKGNVIGSVICQTIDDVNPPLNKEAFFGIAIIALIMLIVVASTSYDVHCQINKKEPHPGYIAFSLYTNGKMLLEAPHRSSPLNCLDGIRVLTMSWIIIHHNLRIDPLGSLYNSKDYVNFNDSLSSMIFIGGTFGPDIFLLVGGLLVIYVFFKKGKSHHKLTFFNVAKHYLHRYIRLTPALAGVVLVSATLMNYMGSGPKWPNINTYFKNFCTKYWWSTLLYIGNLTSATEMCLPHSWYLNIDMQLYVFSPFIFWILLNYTKSGICFLVFFIFVSVVTTFFRAFEYGLSGIAPYYYSKIPSSLYVTKFYVKTETRMSPWLIGAILGYMLTREKYRNIRIPKRIVIPLWIISLCVMVTCVFGADTLKGPEYDRLRNAFYIALTRPVVAIAVGWMIWACATGHGGIINNILSCSIFQFLNKFVYSIYILHVSILYLITFSQKIPLYINVFNLAYSFWGIFALSFGISIIWVLVFESPFVVLEKILFDKNIDIPKTRAAETNDL